MDTVTGNAPRAATSLTMIDTASGAAYSGVVAQKGRWNYGEYTAAKWIARLGHQSVIIQTDGEPAITAFSNQVVARLSVLLPSLTVVSDSRPVLAPVQRSRGECERHDCGQGQDLLGFDLRSLRQEGHSGTSTFRLGSSTLCVVVHTSWNATR